MEQISNCRASTFSDPLSLTQDDELDSPSLQQTNATTYTGSRDNASDAQLQAAYQLGALHAKALGASANPVGPFPAGERPPDPDLLQLQAAYQLGALHAKVLGASANPVGPFPAGERPPSPDLPRIHFQPGAGSQSQEIETHDEALGLLECPDHLIWPCKNVGSVEAGTTGGMYNVHIGWRGEANKV